MLPSEEYEELRAMCRQSQKAKRAEQAQEADEERPPGEEEPATPEGTDSVSKIWLLKAWFSLEISLYEAQPPALLRNLCLNII